MNKVDNSLMEGRDGVWAPVMVEDASAVFYESFLTCLSNHLGLPPGLPLARFDD